MKKPSLEEVKEYFKDAEKCRDWEKEKFIVELDKIKETDKGFVQNPHEKNWGVLYLEGKGYAKILTYKKPEVQEEETFVISKEQLLILKNGYRTEKLLEWFPKAFKEDKKKLPKDFTGWCKNTHYGNEKWMGYYENGFLKYGLSAINADWFENRNVPISDGDIEATEEEVFEALKNEAVKRDLIHGNFAEFGTKKVVREIKSDQYFYDSKINVLLIGSDGIFDNGQWAEICETISKRDAEKLLNKKII